MLAFLIEAAIAAGFGAFAALALNVVLKVNVDPGHAILAGLAGGFAIYCLIRLVRAVRGY